MIVVISPAKTLELEQSKIRDFKLKTTKRIFATETAKLILELKKYNLTEIQELMSISKNLAEQVFDYIKFFESPKFLPKPTILTFKGDVYKAFDFKNYSPDDFAFMQSQILILSGLYGLLRPLDLMPPYRLEMGTNLKTKVSDNLYQFWGDKITLELNKILAKKKNPYLVNLASDEYFKVVTKKLKYPILKIDFKENKNGKFKTIGISAKKARGEMADFVVKNRIQDVLELKKFTRQNYKFNAKLSTTNNFVFTR